MSLNKKEKLKEDLLNELIDQIKDDAKHGDVEVLDELLRMIPNNNLIQALPEENWDKYTELLKK